MLDIGYPIQFVDNTFSVLRTLLSSNRYSKILVLVDDNTARHCLPILQNALDQKLYIIEIAAGESHKNIHTCQQIWQAMVELQADRKSVLINLGGGVIGDMGGFCASTYKRGMDFIQIPTTLLAQVDASVGGKLGIDFALIKNSIGLFCNPKAVCLHTDFFKTLPYEELRSGYAEVLKHALIADPAQWDQLRLIDDLTTANWDKVIAQSLPIKQQIVLEDPYEKGIRKALNFGHTVGHVIESLSWETDTPLLHGHAVAIGMVVEAYLSQKLVGLSRPALTAIKDYINRFYPLYTWQDLDPSMISSLLLQDKKNENGLINCTLLPTIGKAAINIAIDSESVLEGLAYYSS